MGLPFSGRVQRYHQKQAGRRLSKQTSRGRPRPKEAGGRSTAESELKYRTLADSGQALIWTAGGQAMRLLQPALAGFHRPAPGTGMW